jgi:hypothetical protein
MALNQGLVRDVLRQHRLADAIRADQHDVSGVAEELERHQRINGDAVAVLGPAPVEVAKWLEATDVRLAQPSLQTPTGSFLLLPAEQRTYPGFAGNIAPMRQQPVQVERAGAGLLCVALNHHAAP